MNKWYVVPVVALILILFGCNILMTGVEKYNTKMDSIEKAENIQVTVINKSIGIQEDISKNDSFDYYPRVKYNYTVDNEEYTSKNIMPTKWEIVLETEDKAKSYIQEYEINETVTGYYVKGNPDNSFLEKSDRVGVFLTSGFFIFIGSLIIIPSVIILGYCIYRYKKEY